MVKQPVLLAIVLAKLEAGNFRNGVGLVGWLQFAGKQARFGHWLRRVFRIDARASEIEQAGHTSTATPLDEVRGDGEILKNELSGIGRIRMNTANFRGSDDHRIRSMLFEKTIDLILVREIEFVTVCNNNIVEGLRNSAQESRTNHASMTCDKKFHKRMLMEILRIWFRYIYTLPSS